MKLRALFIYLLLINVYQPLFAQTAQPPFQVFDFEASDLKRQIGDEHRRFLILVTPSNAKHGLNSTWSFFMTPSDPYAKKFSWSYKEKPAAEFKNAIYPATWTVNDWSRSSPRHPRFVSKSGLEKLAAKAITDAFDAHFHDGEEEEKFLNAIEDEIRQLYSCLNRAHNGNLFEMAYAYKRFDENLHENFRRYLKNENLSDVDRDRVTKVLVDELMPFLRNEFENNFTVPSSDIIISWRIQILEYQLALLKDSYSRFGFPDRTITEYMAAKMRANRSLESSLNSFKSITESVYNDLSNPNNKPIYTTFVGKYNRSALDQWVKLFSIGDNYLDKSESGLRPLTPSGEDNEDIYRLATLDYLVNILKTSKNSMNRSITP